MKQASILLVDRSEDVLDILVSKLKIHGWDNIHRTSNGDEGIELMKTHPINLVVCGTRIMTQRNLEFWLEAKVLSLAPIILHTATLLPLYNEPYFDKLSEEFFEATKSYLKMLQDRNQFQVPHGE